MMIAQIRYIGTDYAGNQVIEATVYDNTRLWPPVLIAISNTGLAPLKKTVRSFAERMGEKVKFTMARQQRISPAGKIQG